MRTILAASLSRSKLSNRCPARPPWRRASCLDRPVAQESLEVLRHRLSGCVPLVRILGHRLGDDHLEVARDVPVDLVQWRWLVAGNASQEPDTIGVRLCGPQGEALVERDAQSINIAPGVGLAL
jgi:hypothetical protein